MPNPKQDRKRLTVYVLPDTEEELRRRVDDGETTLGKVVDHSIANSGQAWADFNKEMEEKQA